jgi:hypothetical protein
MRKITILPIIVITCIHLMSAERTQAQAQWDTDRLGRPVRPHVSNS